MNAVRVPIGLTIIINVRVCVFFHVCITFFSGRWVEDSKYSAYSAL